MSSDFITLTDGPYGTVTFPDRSQRHQPAEICHRRPPDPSGHYVQVGDRVYEYRGPCSDFPAAHEGFPDPDVCCCGRPLGHVADKPDEAPVLAAVARRPRRFRRE